MLAACNAGRKVLQVPGRNWFGSCLQPTAGNTDNNMNAPGGFNPTPTGTPTGSQTGGAGITNGAPANGAPTNGAPINGPTGGGNAGAIGQGSPCPDQSTVLGQHNQERAGSRAAPLRWSASLAAEAAAWSAKCTPDPLGGYAVSRIGWQARHCSDERGAPSTGLTVRWH